VQGASEQPSKQEAATTASSRAAVSGQPVPGALVFETLNFEHAEQAEEEAAAIQSVATDYSLMLHAVMHIHVYLFFSFFVLLLSTMRDATLVIWYIVACSFLQFGYFGETRTRTRIFGYQSFGYPLISGILRVTVLKTRILENPNYPTRIYRVTRMPRPTRWTIIELLANVKGHGCNFTWAASRAYK
jgi:hypothetical protein